MVAARHARIALPGGMERQPGTIRAAFAIDAEFQARGWQVSSKETELLANNRRGLRDRVHRAG